MNSEVEKILSMFGCKSEIVCGGKDWYPNEFGFCPKYNWNPYESYNDFQDVLRFLRDKKLYEKFKFFIEEKFKITDSLFLYNLSLKEMMESVISFLEVKKSDN